MTDNQPGALPSLDEPGDAELISAVRAGDVNSYGLLFERHVEAARRLARQLVSAGDVDDLVSESFAKVLSVLQKGGGPDLAFRAYLLTSLRRLHVDKIRSGARLQTTDDLTPYDPGVPFEDTAVSGFENATAAKAFSSLPERWQQVLWHTEVEGQKPADIAPLLGISANSVSALAYRAREGLRQAFITMHAQDAVEDACATTRANLGAYIRNGVSRRDAAKVEGHLQECRPCTAIYLELTEVNSNLGALLAPMVLGTAGAGYLAASHAAAAVGLKGGLILLLGRGKDWLVSNPVAGIGAGVVAAGVIAAGIAVGVTGHNQPGAPVAGATPPPVPSSALPSSPAAPPATTPAPAASAPSSPKPAARPTPKPTPEPTPKPPVVPGPPAAPAAPTAPSTTPPSIPALPSTPPAAPVAPPAPVDKAPVITTPLSPQSATPGSTVVIDLIRGATSPSGYPLHVVTAAAQHGTVHRTSARTAPAVYGGAGGDSATDALYVADRPSAVQGVGDSAGGGTVTYRPNPGWRGTDTIHYVLGDGHGGTVAGSVQVTTPNTPPVAHDRDLTATRGTSCTGSCTVGGTLPLLPGITDANHDTVRVVGLGAGDAQTVHTAYGTATLSSDGTLTYTANPTTSSPARVDHVSYTVVDVPPKGYVPQQSTATVTINIPEIDQVSLSGKPVPLLPSATYEHVHLLANVPDTHTATVHVVIHGFTGWADGETHSGCGATDDEPAGTLDLTCEVDGGQGVDVLHYDFDHALQWDFTATISPNGYVDTTPDDNTFHRDQDDLPGS